MRQPYNLRLLEAGHTYGMLTVVSDKPGTDPVFSCGCGQICAKDRNAVRKGLTKSCGCLHRAHGANLGHARAKQPGYSEAIIHYGSYFRRARRKGLAWSLSFDEFTEIAQQPCFYCGQAPSLGRVFKHNGIDRYDSSMGYCSANSVSCCSICNRAKSNLLPSEFEGWIERVQGGSVQYRPNGYVAIDKITDVFGNEVSWERAVKYGWLQTSYATSKQSDGVYKQEFANLFVDQGRQLLAYCFAFRAPIENYTCSKFGVGTGTTAAAVTDVGLEAPVALSSGNFTGPLDSVDFLTAFVVRASFTLGLSDANGSLITEMGLFSGNDSLMARRVRTVGINKTSDFAPTLTWRLRF